MNGTESDGAAHTSDTVADGAGVTPTDLPAVYVYTYPAYLAAPDDRGRVRLKVGKADSSAVDRIRAQARETGLPEDEQVLRVYSVAADEHRTAQQVEYAIHSALLQLGHERVTGSRTGTEWFHTDIETLDALAIAAGLSGVGDRPGAVRSTQRRARPTTAGPRSPSLVNRGPKEAWITRQFTPGHTHENIAKGIENLRKYIDFYCRGQGLPLRPDFASLAEEHGIDIGDVIIGG